MDWGKIREDLLKAVLIYVVTAILGAVGAAIKAGQLGLLVSLRGTAHLLSTGVPLWLFLCFLTSNVFLVLILRRFGWLRKPVLHVVWQPGQTWWHQGSVAGNPAMQVVGRGIFSNADKEAFLILTKAYFKGTECVMGFLEPITLKPGVAIDGNIHVFLRPVIAKPGREFRGKLIFVDQFNRKHFTEETPFQTR